MWRDADVNVIWQSVAQVLFQLAQDLTEPRIVTSMPSVAVQTCVLYGDEAACRTLQDGIRGGGVPFVSVGRCEMGERLPECLLQEAAHDIDYLIDMIIVGSLHAPFRASAPPPLRL
jgi:hypothetical protein